MSTAVVLFSGDGNVASRLISGQPAILYAAEAARACADVVVQGGPADLVSVVRRAYENGADVVLLHDVARPLAPVGLLRSVIEAVRDGAAVAAPMLPISDTVKNVSTAGHVLSTVDRDTLREVQTPYGISVRLIDRPDPVAARTPSELAWRLGDGRITALPGHPDAFEIDGPTAIALAEQVLAGRA
jgi:2-C-methyl-D-erythritol 4-phosphate cytidylyltransferase